MLPQWLIEKKRDGETLSTKEITDLINDYTADKVPDYQMAAFAMAVFFRGMSFEETSALTEAMMRSGDIVDTSSITLPKVDKHSTGGVGDKVSLILAPLVACCGIVVPMISGRGLGITGGTLDKLESIPGYRTDLSENEFLSVLKSCGCSITGQTKKLAPADKKLYALRDVTGTVPSVPLITASILCKKLAEGIDALVLDVKVGKGAFMKTIEQADELARTMVSVGKVMGKKVQALITDMSEPLGRCAGNGLEVLESVETLQGNGAPDLVEITLELGASMLLLAGKSADRNAAKQQLAQLLKNGEAFKRFRNMVGLQGGDLSYIDSPERLVTAKIQEEVVAGAEGFIHEVDAEKIGRAVIALGGGRSKMDDTVDFAVGISDIIKKGSRVQKGDRLFVMHANTSERLARGKELALEAVRIAEGKSEVTKLIHREIS